MNMTKGRVNKVAKNVAFLIDLTKPYPMNTNVRHEAHHGWP
jgi:hypothetical protein